METENDLLETIRHEGSEWVLYTKDGSKVLGKFASKVEAEKREMQIQFFKRQREGASNMIGFAGTAAGGIELVGGGPVIISREKVAGDIHAKGVYNMDDDELRAARGKILGLRADLRTKHDGLDDSAKYSTSAGRALFDDIDYYSRMIGNIENEMLMRLLEL